jgi:hypothetical protein
MNGSDSRPRLRLPFCAKVCASDTLRTDGAYSGLMGAMVLATCAYQSDWVRNDPFTPLIYLFISVPQPFLGKLWSLNASQYLHS